MAGGVQGFGLSCSCLVLFLLPCLCCLVALSFWSLQVWSPAAVPSCFFDFLVGPGFEGCFSCVWLVLGLQLLRTDDPRGIARLQLFKDPQIVLLRALLVFKLRGHGLSSGAVMLRCHGHSSPAHILVHFNSVGARWPSSPRFSQFVLSSGAVKRSCHGHSSLYLGLIGGFSMLCEGMPSEALSAALA
ncbi:hypothetical protein U1Q18_011201 [Sarracenia purpurea var. burkii]